MSAATAELNHSQRAKMVRRPSPLERTAYHEAGHAVASYVLRRRFLEVSIVPEKAKETLGHCRHARWGEHIRPDVELTRAGRARLQTAVLTALAGGEAEAEALFVGRRNHRGASSDNSTAVDLASYVVDSDPEECDAYLGWLGLRVKNLLRQEPHWAAVQALAAERARAVIRDSISRSDA